ncbi:MAG: AAA family ATPase [Nitrospira sp.]|nr:AAA family ATPase [Nitrospira sp.]
MGDTEKDIVQIVRLALTGKESDLRAYTKRTLAPILRRRPDLVPIGKEVLALLEAGSPVRSATATVIDPLPVDLDTRQELIRRESLPELPMQIVWPPTVLRGLKEIENERDKQDKLIEAGLSPSRTILFVGPPGVGKTMGARWVANQLHRPLLTLDLAAVMSSYLGKTGNNIRAVLEFAKKRPSVLLLDEFDAIAKRRDDTAEVGELKRLVTVLLQAIDDWPIDGVLIAATNHPELLDPAVWRRFDRIIEFPHPTDELRQTFIEELLTASGSDNIDSQLIQMLTAITSKQSFSEVKREVDHLRRHALLFGTNLEEAVAEFVTTHIKNATTQSKLGWAKKLVASGYSQHKIHAITGLSRDTLRNHFPDYWDKRPRPRRSLATNGGANGKRAQLSAGKR